MVDIVGKFCHEKLDKTGIIKLKWNQSDTIIKALIKEDYKTIDSYFENQFNKNGSFHSWISNFIKVDQIEHLISIRDSLNPYEEDGIWHDDGSRKLAFTLSLCQKPELIEGGVFSFRKMGFKNQYNYPPQPIGTLLIFKTGVDRYEHKIHQVTKNKRIIIAGWIS